MRTDVPYEVELDCAELARRGKLAAPSCRAKVPWTAFAVAATIKDGRQLLPVECLQSTNATSALLRFAVPKGTVGLMAIADAPRGAEMQDSEGCDNALQGALAALPTAFTTDPAKSWTGDASLRRDGIAFGAGTSARGANVTKNLAGRPFKFEADLRTLGGDARGVRVTILADGAEIFSATEDCPTDVRREVRGTGECPKTARRLDVAVSVPEGERVLLSRLNLRPAGVIECE